MGQAGEKAKGDPRKQDRAAKDEDELKHCCFPLVCCLEILIGMGIILYCRYWCEVLVLLYSLSIPMTKKDKTHHNLLFNSLPPNRLSNDLQK
jgi:hypothetical protein